MGQLTRINSPQDVRRLTSRQADDLAAEIRTFLVDQVSRTGGHLGPNLGVVELTIAMHRVFESPLDTMVFDTGHQAYVHKLLTGRRDFSQLRSKGGLSGYPSRAESEHDVVENSHASTALSWADGIAKANELQGRGDRHVVAVIGDGALTGGMAWEALNNIAAGPGPPARHRRQRQRPLLRADHRRPRPPPRHAAHDARLRERPVLGQAHAAPVRRARPGDVRRAARHEEGHQGRPGAAGHVRGPRHQVRRPGRRARRARGRAGAAQREGVRRARDRARHHREGPRATSRPSRTSRTGSTRSARSTPRPGCPSRRRGSSGPASSPTSSCASAAGARTSSRSPRRCSSPVGLAPFAAEFPTRVFDVGIAEQHAATSAAGHGLRRAAPGRRGVRHVPQPRVRPGAHGRRAAQGRRHVRARPRRAHRRRRREPQRHVGHGDARRRPRPAARGTARRGDAARRAAHRGRRRRRAHGRSATRRARWSTPSPRSTTSTASTSSPGTTARPTRSTCSSSGTARWRRPRSRPRELLAAHGLRVDRRRPAVGHARLRGAHQARGGPRPRGHHRGRRRRRRPRVAGGAAGARGRASGRPCRPSASRARSSTTPPASSW